MSWSPTFPHAQPEVEVGLLHRNATACLSPSCGQPGFFMILEALFDVIPLPQNLCVMAAPSAFLPDDSFLSGMSSNVTFGC